MKFGRVMVDEAEGTILAHSIKLRGVNFKKGRLLTNSDVALLKQADCEDLVVARLGPNDLSEDEAARRIATIFCGNNITSSEPFAGRCNLYAETAGLLDYQRTRVDGVNLIDEAITIATLPVNELVAPHQMLATVKIIPYGVDQTVLEAVEKLHLGNAPLLRVAELKPRTVGLVQSTLPGMRDSVLDKTVATLQARLGRLGSQLLTERRCDHHEEKIAEALQALNDAGCDLLLIAGASATADRRDVVPLGIELAGGQILHVGMPVEPGNLLLLGEFSNGQPIVCLPGCARSPVLNGFDWVLERLVAGIPVGREDIMRMGAGGLIKGTVAGGTKRPGRERANSARTLRVPKVGAVVLGAGLSERMGDTNKLLAPIDGQPMIARVVEQVTLSRADPIVVVTGHEAENIRATLREYDVGFVDNPDYAEGLSSSLRAGIAALPEYVEGVCVCLGDMPWITSADVDTLLAAFDPADGRAICIATHTGRRGNPVLWASQYFPEMLKLGGDTGARELLKAHSEVVCEVQIAHDGILKDIDLPETLTQYATANS